MKKNLESQQLNYLFSLSKTKPQELLYLLNLNYPSTAFKRDEFLISKNYLSAKNGILSVLDLEGESRDMDTHIIYEFQFGEFEFE